MLDELRKLTAGRRTLILGVGNRMRGDDAAGPILLDRLQGKIKFDCLDVEDVPENYLDVIERFDPELILIFDAVNLGGKPGTTALLNLDQLARSGSSTHHADLFLVFKALALDPPPQVWMIGIQPLRLDYSAPLSMEVSQSLDMLVELFQNL